MNNSLQIGKLTLKSRILLSPLERVSYVGFRALCAENGAGLTWTEMIRARSITQNTSAVDMIDTIDPCTPTGLQLVAANGKELAGCLNTIEDAILNGEKPHWRNIICIDLNFGCPKPDVVKYPRFMGPAMLCRPERVRDLLSTLYEFKQRTKLTNIKAIGAKMRLGMNEKQQLEKVYLPVVEQANQYLDYLTVHPRHAALPVAEQQPNFTALAEIRSHAKVPLVLIGNGDVTCRSSLNKILTRTKCDAVMVARGAIRNPWLFRHLLFPEKYDEWPSLLEVNEAEAVAIEWEQRWAEVNDGRLKKKYVTFRRLNFERIRNFVRTGKMIVTGNERIHIMKRSALQRQNSAAHSKRHHHTNKSSTGKVC